MELDRKLIIPQSSCDSRVRSVLDAKEQPRRTIKNPLMWLVRNAVFFSFLPHGILQDLYFHES